MSRLGVSATGVASWLNVLRQVDVRPIMASAETPFTMAIVCADDALCSHLVHLMNTGPRDYEVPSALAVLPFSLAESSRASSADLVVVFASAHANTDAEIRLSQALEQAKVPCVVMLVGEQPPGPETLQKWHPVRPHYVPAAGALDDKVVTSKIVHACLSVIGLDPVRIARHVPAFRDAVARKLTTETANVNGVYSATTGVLEINPVALIPLGVADIVVLTKNQGIMAYKIALAFGMPSDVSHVMPQIAAVVGGAFVFRTVARTLVGLLPGIGIVPKTAIAYAGTVAIGEAVHKWCASGEQMSTEALKKVYVAALQRSKALAQGAQVRLKRARKNDDAAASDTLIAELPASAGD